MESPSPFERLASTAHRFKVSRKLLGILGVLLVLVTVIVLQFSPMFVPRVGAVSSYSQTPGASGNDGWNQGVDTTYATAHSGAGNTDNTSSSMDAGQTIASSYYYVKRAFLQFDTSTIPFGSAIITAKLRLYIKQNLNDTQYYLRAQKWTGSLPIGTGDFNQFDGINYDDNTFYSGTFIEQSQYNNMTLTNFTLIEMGGATKICLRNDRDISSTAPIPPNNREYCQIATYDDADAGHRPTLEVTYWASGEEYHYVYQASDVDSSADKGTRSNFTAQQGPPDNINDTLTEAGVVHAESYTYGSAASGTSWSDPTYVYDNNTSNKASWATSSTNVWSTKLVVNLTEACKGTKIRYWVSKATTLAYTTLNISIANATGSWTIVFSTTPTESAYVNATFASSSYTAIGLERYRYTGGSGSQACYMNEVQGVNATWTEAAYSLDIEEQWTNANYTRSSRDLCILTGPFSDSENLYVQWWNTTDSAWYNITNLDSLSALAWNNASVTSYLTAATFTIRIRDSSGADAVQSTWQLDCVVLHTYEFTWSASITVNTATHSWTIDPNQNNVTINENSGQISLTVTSNANFDIQAKADGALTYGPNTIALTNTNMSASTWAAAIPLTTEYQTVPGLSNVAGGTGLAESFWLWLSCPDNKPAGAYVYVLTIQVIQH